MKTYNCVHVIGNMDPRRGGAQKVIDHIRSHQASHPVFNHIVYAALQSNPGYESVCNAGIHKSMVPFVLSRRLERFLDSRRADLVHIHSPAVGPWARAAARRLDLPTVTSLHNRPSKFKGWLWQIERRSLRSDARIACVSNHIREELLQHERHLAPERIHVIPNGIEMTPFMKIAEARKQALDAGHQARSPRLLVFGRLSTQKGFDTCLRAIGVMKKRGYEPRLDVVGKGPEKSALEKLSRRLGISDQVKFHGPTDDVSRFLERCTLAVFPSRWEGLSIAFLEALASGVPIVASDIQSFLETCPECRHFFPVDNFERLAEESGAVLDAIRPEQKKALEMATTMQARYSASRMADSYADLYSHVLNIH